MLHVAEAGFAGQRQHFLGGEEAKERRPAGARALLRELKPGTHLGVREFQRHQERGGERRARGERRDLAQGRRVGVACEIHGDAGRDHDRGPAGVEAGGRHAVAPRSARLEVDRHQPQPVRDAKAELDQPPALPGLRAGPVDLEHSDAGGDLRPALGKRVETGAEDDVLTDALRGLFHDQILDEAGARHDRGAEQLGEMRVHVRALAPAIVRRGQLEADLVFEHMGRRIDRDMQRAPQRDPHRRAVRGWGALDRAWWTPLRLSGAAAADLGSVILVEQFGEFFQHGAAELLGIDDGDGAAVIARDVVADADGEQLDRRVASRSCR